MNRLEKLLDIASQPLSAHEPDASAVQRLTSFPELLRMLRARNGFAVFESALIAFPTIPVADVPSIFDWNAADGWRSNYLDVLPICYMCFAHDLFGLQFAISSEDVIRFNPETGEVRRYANSLVGWADRLLDNFEEDTAWPLAHEWQTLHRGLRPDERLLPKQPFVLGGDYVVENLSVVGCRSAMAYWARLYKATRNVPDGGRISLSGWLV
jgi:hypothetical protein